MRRLILIRENYQNVNKNNFPRAKKHETNNFFLLLFTGGLSVLLVVGDTFVAVTDPLRYHSRISYVKSWVLIASVWSISILFSAISAFRSKWCNIEIDTEFDHTNTSFATKATIREDEQTMKVANIYVIIFSCVYFVLIILVPIIIVCVMYFRIFSEARQSGQRMRRNGSSPLLQSAINLHNPAINTNSLNEQQRYPSLFDVCTPDVLTMKIDSKCIEDGKPNENNKKLTTACVATHQYRRYLDIPENDDQNQTEEPLSKRQRTKSEKCLNGIKPKLAQFRRNFSTRHLSTLEPSTDFCHHTPAFLSKNQSLNRMLTGEMRQVHSSPNLQKLSNLDLLHKIPYNCANNCNRSTSSINQSAAQQTATSPRALSYMISIRHRLSNASSIFKYREESRAGFVGIVVMAMFMVSYLPYGLLILLQGRLTYIPNANLFSVLFILIGNMSSCVLFALRNRRVRRGVCRLFGVDTKPNSYLQKQRMQLRNSQSNTGSTKNVRIHRNLSASNFSLNMLPYKFASQSVLPMLHNSGEQIHGNVPKTINGSVLVPIDDEEFDNETEKTISTAANDLNNNDLKLDANDTDVIAKSHKEKMSLFKRMCSSTSRKSSTSNAEHPTIDPTPTASTKIIDEPINDAI